MLETPLPSRNVVLAIIASFFALSIAVYGLSLGNDFVRFDDGLLIYENPAIREVSVDAFRTIFTSYDPELYIPLTFLSYKLDFAIGGIWAPIYHAHSLFWHVLNALLVAWLFYKLTGKGALALVGGIFFLIHPLHTEAVAWASARKDVLSTFFFLSSMIAYLGYRSDSSKAKYWGSVALFLLGLSAKVMVITLPGVLILLDLLQRRKFDRSIIIDKIPYLILAVIFGIIAINGKEEIISALTPLETFLMACKSTIFYLQKLFVPLGLSALYPYTDPVSPWSPGFFIPLKLTIILVAVTIWGFFRSRVTFFCLAFFLLTLLPTFINFSKAGDLYIASDRYAYIPSIGILLLVGLIIDWFGAQEHRVRAAENRRKLITGAIVIVGLLFAGLAIRQSMMWKSSEALFGNVISLYPNSVIAQNNMGNIYRRQEKIPEAIDAFQKVLAIRPHGKAYVNLGAAYRKLGKFDEAIAEYEKARALDEKNPEVYFGLGLVYADQGKTDEAFAAYARAIELEPTYPDPYVNRGVLYQAQGANERAIAEYRKATEVQPYFDQAHYNLAVMLQKTGKKEEAIASYERVTELRPSFIPARINLGILYAEKGMIDESREQFEAILEVDPGNSAARSALQQLDAAAR